jgi:hypothetical protein
MRMGLGPRATSYGASMAPLAIVLRLNIFIRRAPGQSL